MPVRLVVKSKAKTGASESEELILSEDLISLGREKSCNVVLADGVVSRNHARILREGPLYFLEDAGSSFGTRVNGADLPAGEKRLLRNGDVIAIGPYDLVFDRIADVAAGPVNEKTSFMARRVVKDALRGLASGAAPYLRIMNGPLEGRKVEIHELQEIIIGREEGVDLRLNDDLTSRRHAKVRRDWAGTHIEDLRSRNGVRVNGRRISTHSLKDRDEIEIGSTRLLYLDPSELREPPVVPEERPSQIRSAPAGPPAARTAQTAKPDPAPPAARSAPAARPEPAPPEPEPEPEPEEAEAAEEEMPAEPEEAGEGDGEAEEAAAEESGDPDLDDDEDDAGESEEEPEAPPEEHDEGLPLPDAAHEGPAGRLLGGRLAMPGAWRSLVPVVLVAAIALFAVAVLAVTFFVL
jgi:pSer/pThr/pTyr-binding forkhead associated (FHA) protein